MATKPTKQQVAQAKARAGGNNPVKVTNAGLKKLGSAAVIAASFTPAGRVVRGAATVAKAASGARKASTVAKSSRQAGDYAISGKSAKNVMPKAGSGSGNYRFGRDTEITKNVSIKNTKSPSGKIDIRGGAAQAMRQEDRLSQPLSKAEAKGNARGLKAANAKLSKGNAKREYNKDKINMIMKYNPKDTKADAERWASHPGYASQKSNARLTKKDKWSSEKQIARYQKKEIKTFRKPSK
jgi:aspartate 1-decarboxylase